MKSMFKFTIIYDSNRSFKVSESKEGYNMIESKEQIVPVAFGHDLLNNEDYIESFDRSYDENVTRHYLDHPTFDFHTNKYIIYSFKSDDDVIKIFKQEVLKQKIKEISKLQHEKDNLEKEINDIENEIKELNNELKSNV